MKMYNYAKLLGAFINGQQLVTLALEPKDRAERKMLEEANSLIAKGWERKLAYLKDRQAKADEQFDEAAEKLAFHPVVEGGSVHMPLQYVQDFMVKKMAAIQNNTSIHNTKEVEELKSVFKDYGVSWTSELTELTFDHISWSARPGQKPKLLVHAKTGDTPVVIRFEAAGELCHKFMHAILGLELSEGSVFSIQVEAVDPAIARNLKAGKKVADPGKFVNHNIVVKKEGASAVHTGKPADGKFVQKMTIEQLEDLFQTAKKAVESAMI